MRVSEDQQQDTSPKEVAGSKQYLLQRSWRKRSGSVSISTGDEPLKGILRCEINPWSYTA